ncbi:unnamed protein product [Gongylonema pulchrum]|uniref:ZP domain-containing protein n=1 Tax=Gongylonema pulchrum TaxID=637853 RepID=A0A183D006_9BILA|nr:unnamed protein product [Gongylonema pulchrum]
MLCCCRCSLDPILITGIRYSSDLQRAYAESMVFKFADRPGVWFFCQIQMCMKKSGMCDGVTPPSCASQAEKPEIRYISETEQLETLEKMETTATVTTKPPTRYVIKAQKPGPVTTEFGNAIEETVAGEYLEESTK